MSQQCLKLRFLDLTEVAFCSVHKTENYFSWADERLKQGFLDIAQFVFWVVQLDEIAFQNILDL
jgi:hypothetical protein